MTFVVHQAIKQRLLRSLVIGLGVSLLLNLVGWFVPLPDVIMECLLVAQAPGLWLEIERATPYHVSTLNVILINAAIYAGIAYLVASARTRLSRAASHTA